jgi:hypothetical protein
VGGESAFAQMMWKRIERLAYILAASALTAVRLVVRLQRYGDPGTPVMYVRFAPSRAASRHASRVPFLHFS